MNIQEHNNFTGTSYQINIEMNEDLNSQEIASCFKRQFPNSNALISKVHVKEVYVEMLIVGVKLPKRK